MATSRRRSHRPGPFPSPRPLADAIVLIGVALLAAVVSTASFARERADEAEIVIPLADFRREVAIVLKGKGLEGSGWDRKTFESIVREEIGYAEAAGVDLERIGFKGILPDSSVDLVEARIRPITFVPRESLEGLAARLTAGGRTAEEALGEVGRLAGRAKNLVPLLLPAVRQGKDRCVVTAIQWIGPQAAEAIPTLVRMVREEDDLLDAHEYGRTLARIGGPAISALEALLREGGGEHARSTGGSGLAQCGPAGAAALRAALALPDAAVRKEAASALGAAPPEAESAKALIPLLQDARPEVRQAAAWSLGRLGDLARDAGQGLLRMLDEPDAASRQAALYGLAGIPAAAPAAAPAIGRFLKTGGGEEADEDCRAALVAVKSYGRDAAFLAPRVAACLESRTEEGHINHILVAALEALAAIGGREAAVALTDVERIAGTKDWETCPAALDALFFMGPDGAAAGKTVLGIATDRSVDVGTRFKSVGVLGATGSPAREALDDLLPFVTMERGSVTFPPRSVLRVMASADLPRAIALVSREAEKGKESLFDQGPALARGSLVLLRAIEADVAAVEEALRGGEGGRYGAAALAPGSGAVQVSWEWIERWHRVLRPGDPITRVVGLLGRPAAAGPVFLEYRSDREGEESSRGGPGVTGRGERPVLRIALAGGRVKDVKLAPAEAR